MKQQTKKRLNALSVTSLMVGTAAMGVISTEPAHASMVDGFLRVDGIPGESQDAKHKNEIDVISYSQTFSKSPQECNTIKITKKLDTASPRLASAATTGSPIPNMILTLRKAGKDQGEFYKVMLKDVTILGTEFSLAQGNVPMENITLKPRTAVIEYRQQRPES